MYMTLTRLCCTCEIQDLRLPAWLILYIFPAILFASTHLERVLGVGDQVGDVVAHVRGASCAKALRHDPQHVLPRLLLQRDNAAEHDAHALEHLRRGYVMSWGYVSGFCYHVFCCRESTSSKMMRLNIMRTPFGTCGAGVGG